MKLITTLLLAAGLLAAQDAGALWQPYYTYPRAGAQQIDLTGQWELGHRDTAIEEPAELNNQKWIKTPVPATVQMSLFRAGRHPHPYYHLNSKEYEWVDEKVWYYRTSFNLPAEAGDGYIFLCFDGIDYFSRVWVNGKLLGRHEGMFGGPVIEISEAANPGGANGVVVEVKAGNWGNKDGYQPRQPGRVIKPTGLAGGNGAEMFFPLGMWQGARVELVPKVHLERPFLTTAAATEEEATLHLSAEVLANTHSLEHSLHPLGNEQLSEFRDTSTAEFIEEPFMLRFELIDKFTRRRAFRENISLELYEGRNWIEYDLTVPSPKLWWPNGLGDANLYTARLALHRGGKAVDTISFDYGIRTLATSRGAGPRTADRWANWQFNVNGRDFFVKGVNWMPADILLNVPHEWYHWLLSAARNAGIQMVRVWGGGLIEPEAFYAAANELGILVWQDFPIGNGTRPDWPRDVWESQVMQTVFRLRNHPSLAVYCGGSEFNAYAGENAAVIGILERSLADFDPTRPFLRTSPDAGSVHAYPDMDPTWYARIYRELPYMAETGMPSIPDPETFGAVVSAKELGRPLGNLWSPEFEKEFPEFRHHFAEFEPSRVPRMLSRASHIDDISAPGFEALAEATQLGAGEFYQIMSEALQANYPVTTGLMPWAFKRPWPVAGIQLLDGFGHPAAPYYFLKRTYEPTHVMVRLPHLLVGPGEEVPLTLTILHAPASLLFGLAASVEVMDDSFETIWRQERSVAMDSGPSVIDFDLGSFQVPDGYADRFIFIVAELKDQGGALVSRSVYWPRSLSTLDLEEFRRKPTAWPKLENGPWLKPAVAKSESALEIYLLNTSAGPSIRSLIHARVKNTGSKPIPVTELNVEGTRRSFFASDNFFWLSPGEERDVTIQVLWRDSATRSDAVLTAGAWNAPTKKVPLR